MSRLFFTLALAALLLGALFGCEQRDHGSGDRAGSGPVAALRASSEPPAPAGVPVQAGDPARGRELVQRFECNRCHEATGLGDAAFDKHCVRCHTDIWAGRFRGRTPAAAAWKEHIAHVRVAPSLEGAGARLQASWVERFVREPHDIRPHLAPSMPRLSLDAGQARDVAAYLASLAPPPATAALSFDDADPERGRQLLENKGCGSCHEFSGVPALPTRPEAESGPESQRLAVQLAPDLRYARERLNPHTLIAWLRDPRKLKRDTLMPSSGLSADEARDLAAYLWTAALAALPDKPPPVRLPLLDRRVSFDEVQKRVLGRTCGHCHGNADATRGDGGPGNTGGFGFAPRRLDLTSYSGVASGLLDDRGERHSVFEKLDDGTPRLVAALLARGAEEAGRPDPRVRGMPLGLPALPAEDIQLVDSWIAQGRPR